MKNVEAAFPNAASTFSTNVISRMFRTCKSLSLMTILATAIGLGQDRPQPLVAMPDFRFARTIGGAVIERHYLLTNTGAAPLRILRADMTPPLRPSKLPAIVGPGEQAMFSFRLDTAKVAGYYEGLIVLITDHAVQPEIQLTFEGEVVPPIEFRPMAAFFVSTQRGSSKSTSMEIFNHREEPLKILSVESSSNRFSLDLRTLVPGKHYELALTMHPDAVSGKTTEAITLTTSDPNRPVLKIEANTLVRDRVYTFPDRLSFDLPQSHTLKRNSGSMSRTSQTLMVYQAGGKDFQIAASTEAPFLELRTIRSELGDRYQIEVSVLREKLRSGPVDGSIVITTNDPEFSRLSVPVTVE